MKIQFFHLKYVNQIKIDFHPIQFNLKKKIKKIHYKIRYINKEKLKKKKTHKMPIKIKKFKLINSNMLKILILKK